MKEFHDLLARGYFPRELPPTFTTDNFASILVNNWAAHSKKFHFYKQIARINSHSIPRSGSLRRQLGIPNPIVHLGLCNEIILNWQVLTTHIKQSNFSTSKPVLYPGPGRAILPQVPQQSDLIPIRARIRAGAKFVLHTDVSRFYHSIYTHSIPWALHGKAVAKSQQSNIHLGNRLDTLIRNAQDRQTIGVPIGPDASLVIAEVILSVVDKQIEQKFPNIYGLRYIDDYEFAFASQSEAESFLALLQRQLAEFELEPNPRKTTITELPIPFEYPWISELRSLPLRDNSPKNQARDLLRLFDRAFQLSHDYPDQHILKYLVARLKGMKLDPKNWELFQHLVLQCVMVEPVTISNVIGHLIEHSKSGLAIEKGTVTETLSRLIRIRAPLDHANEVAWALWGLLTFNLIIDQGTADAISQTDDSVVALLALHGRELGIVPSTINTSSWESYMTKDELYGPQWLLSYEANVKGWLPSTGTSDHVLDDSSFSILKSLGISFYDRTKTTNVTLTGAAMSFGTAPVFSP